VKLRDQDVVLLHTPRIPKKQTNKRNNISILVFIILIVCGTINCKAHCEMTQEDVGHLPELVGGGGGEQKRDE
jgi:hypothetical protein